MSNLFLCKNFTVSTSISTSFGMNRHVQWKFTSRWAITIAVIFVFVFCSTFFSRNVRLAKHSWTRWNDHVSVKHCLSGNISPYCGDQNNSVKLNEIPLERIPISMETMGFHCNYFWVFTFRWNISDMKRTFTCIQSFLIDIVYVGETKEMICFLQDQPSDFITATFLLSKTILLAVRLQTKITGTAWTLKGISKRMEFRWHRWKLEQKKN